MRRLFLMVAASAAAAAGMVSPPDAQACGDKLMVLGGGVPFERIHGAHRQGSLILYLAPESRLAATNGEVHLDQTLTRAGHRVRAVRNSAELQQAIDEAKVDFVLMDWSAARQLQSGAVGGVPVVPVTYGSSAEERAAALSRPGCVVESVRGRGRALVRAVETLLENQPGSALSCTGAVASG